MTEIIIPSGDSGLVAMAKEIAKSQAVDPVLVCAVIEQESAWDCWAIRYEPIFMRQYVAPHYTAWKISATEAWARAYSWGAMQVMGQVARENGFTGKYLSELCDPKTGVTVGCTVLKHKLALHDGDVTKGLLAWNGGSNALYPVQVLERMTRYK